MELPEKERSAFNTLGQNNNAGAFMGNYMPSPIPEGKGPRSTPSVQIKSNPVFNIQPGASVTDSDKAKLMEALGVTNEELARRMKAIIRDQERTKVR